MQNYFPPGYDYRREWLIFCILLGLGSLSLFLVMGDISAHKRYLDRQWTMTVYWMILPGEMAQPFLYFFRKVIYFFTFSGVFAISQTTERRRYLNSTTKSIYLMKRLPKRSVLYRAIWGDTLLELALWIAALLLIGLLCFAYYWLQLPKFYEPRFW
jgi:hypothetical protein